MTIEERFKELAEAADAANQTELKRKILDLQKDVLADIADQKRWYDVLSRTVSGVEHHLGNALVPLSTFRDLLESSHQNPDYRMGLRHAMDNTSQTIRGVIDTLRAQLQNPETPASPSDF